MCGSKREYAASYLKLFSNCIVIWVTVCVCIICKKKTKKKQLNWKVQSVNCLLSNFWFFVSRAKMMCEVMPTISEDTALSQRGSQSSASDPDSHFEQLMVNMLDERDRLLDTLRETQESLGLAQQHLQDVIYDRDSLQRQLSSALPQVSSLNPCFQKVF